MKTSLENKNNLKDLKNIQSSQVNNQKDNMFIKKYNDLLNHDKVYTDDLKNPNHSIEMITSIYNVNLSINQTPEKSQSHKNSICHLSYSNDEYNNIDFLNNNNLFNFQKLSLCFYSHKKRNKSENQQNIKSSRDEHPNEKIQNPNKIEEIESLTLSSKPEINISVLELNDNNNTNSNDQRLNTYLDEVNNTQSKNDNPTIKEIPLSRSANSNDLKKITKSNQDTKQNLNQGHLIGNYMTNLDKIEPLKSNNKEKRNSMTKCYYTLETEFGSKLMTESNKALVYKEINTEESEVIRLMPNGKNNGIMSKSTSLQEGRTNHGDRKNRESLNGDDAGRLFIKTEANVNLYTCTKEDNHLDNIIPIAAGAIGTATGIISRENSTEKQRLLKKSNSNNISFNNTKGQFPAKNPIGNYLQKIEMEIKQLKLKQNTKNKKSKEVRDQSKDSINKLLKSSVNLKTSPFSGSVHDMIYSSSNNSLAKLSIPTIGDRVVLLDDNLGYSQRLDDITTRNINEKKKGSFATTAATTTTNTATTSFQKTISALNSPSKFLPTNSNPQTSVMNDNIMKCGHVLKPISSLTNSPKSKISDKSPYQKRSLTKSNKENILDYFEANQLSKSPFIKNVINKKLSQLNMPCKSHGSTNNNSASKTNTYIQTEPEIKSIIGINQIGLKLKGNLKNSPGNLQQVFTHHSKGNLSKGYLKTEIGSETSYETRIGAVTGVGGAGTGSKLMHTYTLGDDINDFDDPKIITPFNTRTNQMIKNANTNTNTTITTTTTTTNTAYCGNRIQTEASIERKSISKLIEKQKKKEVIDNEKKTKKHNESNDVVESISNRIDLYQRIYHGSTLIPKYSNSSTIATATGSMGLLIGNDKHSLSDRWFVDNEKKDDLEKEKYGRL